MMGHIPEENERQMWKYRAVMKLMVYKG